MPKKFLADLHIHTCLSPCADLLMTPAAIVTTALRKGLDIIAITDHNSAENTVAALRAAENTGLTVLSGMEVTSSEEAHILTLFDESGAAAAFEKVVYQNLLSGENDAGRFGDQIVVNEKDEVLSFNRRLLIAATALPAKDIISQVRSLGGLAIASHIDRGSFSIISQLGFISDDLRFDALELSPRISRTDAERSFEDYRSFPWISSSDAHTLEDIGKRQTVFHMENPCIEEILLALQGREDRIATWI